MANQQGVDVETMINEVRDMTVEIRDFDKRYKAMIGRRRELLITLVKFGTLQWIQDRTGLSIQRIYQIIGPGQTAVARRRKALKEERMADQVEDYYSGEVAPLPTGVVPSDARTG